MPNRRKAGKNKSRFTVCSKKVIYGKWPVHLMDYKIKMPDGRIISRQIIEPPGAAVIIPRVSRDRFILIRQFRLAARAWLWEWPAGGREPHESPRKTAARELAEETGFYPRKLKRLASFYPTPGVSSEVMHLFLAENLYPRREKGDEDEEIEIHEFSLRQIERMIASGKICDGKTILGFFYLKGIV